MTKMTLRDWGLGAFGAAINAGVGGITLMIVDPSDFNFFGSGDILRLVKVCAALALVGFALYVKEHPIPLVDQEKV